MATWHKYRRTAIAEMAEWVPGMDMRGVSISEADRANGSPQAGDMIARNPANHADKWLVSAEYFAANFAPTGSAIQDALRAKPLTILEPDDVLNLIGGPCAADVMEELARAGWGCSLATRASGWGCDVGGDVQVIRAFGLDDPLLACCIARLILHIEEPDKLRPLAFEGERFGVVGIPPAIYRGSLYWWSTEC